MFCTDKKGYDKILHIIAGALICLIVGVTVAHFFGHNPWLTSAIAISAVILAAIGREIYNAFQHGNHFCIWDIKWTVFGGLAVVWIPWIAAWLLSMSG